MNPSNGGGGGGWQNQKNPLLVSKIKTFSIKIERQRDIKLLKLSLKFLYTIKIVRKSNFLFEIKM